MIDAASPHATARWCHGWAPGRRPGTGAADGLADLDTRHLMKGSYRATDEFPWTASFYEQNIGNPDR